MKIHIDENNFYSNSVKFIEQKLSEINNYNKPIVTLCIGTDRSTGDCLGPLVGWYLKKEILSNDLVFGTIDEPVHAVNISEALCKINTNFNYPPIIAVDACLGRLESIGFVNITRGSLKPGAAVNKNLPAVGDISISGLVNVGGFMDYFVLQSTRLSFVMKMADKISHVLATVYSKNYL